MPYLHHCLIHFPIALSLVAVLYAALSWLRSDGAWTRSAHLASYLAALSAVASATTGLLSAHHAIEDGLDAGAVELHRNVALIATALLLVSALLVRIAAGRQSGRAAKVGAGLGLVGAMAVTAAAHFGGDMLHPGLAPWSKEKHSHGRHDDVAEHNHDAVSPPAHTHRHDEHGGAR